MLKKCKVVMLPTEKAIVNNIIKSINGVLSLADRARHGNKIFEVGIKDTNGYYIPQHLYITSDEEIKEDDWFISTFVNIITKANKENIKVIKDINIIDKIYNSCTHYKIIASTNPSLNLHQPSPSFITKFIEEYNKGNTITKVMVGYGIGYHKSSTFYSIVTRVIDNTITIRKVEDSWTREEVKQLCWQAYMDHYTKDGKIAIKIIEATYDDFNNWIEQNL